MYKVITIDGKDYKLEFTIEASLYNDCIERVMHLMLGLDDGRTSNDPEKLLSGMSDIPSTAMSCFYAGLLEHHGTEGNGDGSVPDLHTAKRLAVSLIRNTESDINNWYDLLTMCAEQMGEDGFFDLIGLGSFLGTENKKSQKKAVKVPQDHKPKSKASEA